MIYLGSSTKAVVLLLLLVPNLVASSQQIESVAYEGQLQVGKRESTIVYLGKESGDLAAFCFTNKSSVGRAILSKCKDGEQCKFRGRIDWNISCSIKGHFSAQAKIVSLKSVRRLVRKRQV